MSNYCGNLGVDRGNCWGKKYDDQARAIAAPSGAAVIGATVSTLLVIMGAAAWTVGAAARTVAAVPGATDVVGAPVAVLAGAGAMLAVVAGMTAAVGATMAAAKAATAAAVAVGSQQRQLTDRGVRRSAKQKSTNC
jgi:hypothetical protein